MERQIPRPPSTFALADAIERLHLGGSLEAYDEARVILEHLSNWLDDIRTVVPVDLELDLNAIVQAQQEGLLGYHTEWPSLQAKERHRMRVQAKRVANN